MAKTHFRESVECPVLVDIEFSGSAESPGRHNPLKISRKRRGLCLIFVPFAKSSHHCFSRFNCLALFWLPGAGSELVLSPASSARQVLLWPWRGGQAGGGTRLPSGDSAAAPAVLPRAVSCCQRRMKQASLSPVLFPLCQLVMFI